MYKDVCAQGKKAHTQGFHIVKSTLSQESNLPPRLGHFTIDNPGSIRVPGTIHEGTGQCGYGLVADMDIHLPLGRTVLCAVGGIGSAVSR